MVHYTCKSNTFIRIHFNIPRTVIRQDRREMSYLEYLRALLGTALSTSFSGNVFFTNLNTAWGCHHFLNAHISIFRLSLYVRHYLSTSTMSSNNSSGSATNGSVSRIIKTRVFADQPGPNHPVHTPVPCRSHLFPPSRLIGESDISAHCGKAAVIKPQLTIEEPDVWDVRLHSDIYVSWARYPRLNITLGMLESETAVKRK